LSLTAKRDVCARVQEREREKKKSTTQSVLQVNTEVRLADMPANKFGRQKHGANTSKHVLLVSCL
jgi:hypothetical protein